MKYLIQGGEDPERLALIIEGTAIRSDDMISALEDHYVRGHTAAMAAMINGIDAGNFCRAQSALEAEAGRIERIKQLDWPHYRSQLQAQPSQPRAQQAQPRAQQAQHAEHPHHGAGQPQAATHSQRNDSNDEAA